MIELKPIRETTDEYDQIEKRIKDLFRKEIYLPILRDLSKNKKLKNSKDDLIEAIKSGRITYNLGKFSGELNSTLTKEVRALGAVWDKTRKCYSLKSSQLPIDVRLAISSSAFKFQETIDKIDKKLASVVPDHLADKLKIDHLFDKTLWKVESKFQKNVKNLTVAPKLTDHEAKRISKDWQNNMKLWIKNFTEKEIKKLRSEMRESVFTGNRYESAIKSIQSSYNVTANKARFLARQETALLMTTYTYGRYQDAGINEYKWRAVVGTPAHPTRPMHKELSARSDRGEIFRFDQPPVDDPNGSRHNPGTNYNCRCTAIPVVRFKK